MEKKEEVAIPMVQQFYLDMQNIDLTQNKKISENWWKFIMSSMLSHQGLSIKNFLVRECDLDNQKVKNIILGTSLGLRKLL
jgi:hypothetical protein